MDIFKELEAQGNEAVVVLDNILAFKSFIKGLVAVNPLARLHIFESAVYGTELNIANTVMIKFALKKDFFKRYSVRNEFFHDIDVKKIHDIIKKLPSKTDLMIRFNQFGTDIWIGKEDRELKRLGYVLHDVDTPLPPEVKYEQKVKLRMSELKRGLVSLRQTGHEVKLETLNQKLVVSTQNKRESLEPENKPGKHFLSFYDYTYLRLIDKFQGFGKMVDLEFKFNSKLDVLIHNNYQGSVVLLMIAPRRKESD